MYKDFQPLHIRAILQTPVISDKFLPLDAVLYNQFIRSHFGPKKSGHSPRESIVRQGSGLQMPIQKRNMNSDHQWYYACSFALIPEITQRSKHSYAKRFDTDLAIDRIDFGGKRGKVDTKSGTFKNYFITDYTWSVPYIDWYCRADKKWISEMLHFCTHIGKKSSQGCGSVLRWEVNETEKDWYLKDEDGRLLRAIPHEKGYAIYGIRPAYWLQRHQFKCYLPDQIPGYV